MKMFSLPVLNTALKGLRPGRELLCAVWAGAAMILCVLPAATFADTAAVTFIEDPLLIVGDPAGGSNHGWKFSPLDDIVVTELGLYDDGADGLLGPHEIGIFDTAGVLLVSTVMDAGTSLELDNNFRWKDITDITLSKNMQYVISYFSSADSNADEQVNTYSSLQFTSQINYLGALWSSFDTAFELPTKTAPDARVGPNFRFTAIPEPATLALLGLGAFGLRKRRQSPNHRKQ